MQSLYVTVVVIVAWLVLCAVMWRIHKARQHVETKLNSTVLIAYASQTGNAQAIAQSCAQALHLSATSVISLNNLTLEHLKQVEKVLFVVSTYGDGEAPDNGHLFAKHIVNHLPSVGAKQANVSRQFDLSHLHYSIVALGDSSYPDFCSFGFELNQLMSSTGAQLLGDVITVDNYEQQSTELADITPGWLNIQSGNKKVANVESTNYWQLAGREILNPGCKDEALVQLTFDSIGPRPIWQAGDLIEIQPQQPIAIIDTWLNKNNLDGEMLLNHQAYQQSLKVWLVDRELPEHCEYAAEDLLVNLPYLHKRSYSIASVSADKQLQLVVRLLKKEDNSLGLASGYIGHYCNVGDVIQGQIKSISHHHNMQTTQAIILIGAGSGLAGLKAQIAARKVEKLQHNQTIGDSWLIFGERNSSPQLPINAQLAYLKEQYLTKLSCAFSQDSQYPKYVQHILLNEQAQLKLWLENGAAIYVCGCLAGMGESVHQTLLDILGEEAVESLQQQERYIRDVY